MDQRRQPGGCGRTRQRPIYYILSVLLFLNLILIMEIPLSLLTPQRSVSSIHMSASAFSIGRFGWPGLEWREIIDWWTSGYSRGVVIGRNYIPPCKLCDMPRMFRVDK